MNKQIKILKEQLIGIDQSEDILEIEELETNLYEIEQEINDLLYNVSLASPQYNSLKALSILLLKIKRDYDLYVEDDELNRMFDQDDEYFDEF